MDPNLLLRNRAVARIVVGIPTGQQQLRARIESASGDVITLGEATLAALTRAYVGIKTHPERTAVELIAKSVDQRKDGFAAHQLLEVQSDPIALAAELSDGPKRATSPPLRDTNFATQRLPNLDTSSGALRTPLPAPGEGVFGEIPTLSTPRSSLLTPGDNDS
jgi:hypothetical protein